MFIRQSLLPLLFLLLALQACNQDEQASANSELNPPPTPGESVSNPDKINQSTDDSLHDGITAPLLLNGDRVSGLSATGSERILYVVLIPDGARNFVVETTSGLGALSLSVDYGSETSCHSDTQGTTQICQITVPEDGEYVITLTPDTEFSAVDLAVRFEDPGVVEVGTAGCDISELEQDLLDAHNLARAEARECGGEYFEAAGPLTWSCELNRAAYLHSKDMAENDYFDHTNLAGESPATRATKQGYDYRIVGENIAAGQRSVADAMEGWLDSPGHCANIMRADYTELGATRADANSSTYKRYWTAMFGRPR